jgi:hypothetical protein
VPSFDNYNPMKGAKERERGYLLTLTACPQRRCNVHFLLPLATPEGAESKDTLRQW